MYMYTSYHSLMVKEAPNFDTAVLLMTTASFARHS